MGRGGEREPSVQICANDPAQKKKERKKEMLPFSKDFRTIIRRSRIMLAHNHTM